MSTDTVAPEIRLFLARVRHELADLDPAEVDEITDGLEADLAELVAERGAAALGRPEEYAAELRSAAGLAARTRTRLRFSVRGRGEGEVVTALLDGAHARFDRLVAVAPGDQRPLLAWLRPVWWIARAWIAVVAGVGILRDATGSGDAYYVPDLVPHGRGLGWPITLLAVLISVQIGRGRIWPGGRRGLGPRVVLLALNALAAALVPVTLASVRNEPAPVDSVASARPVPGLVSAGRPVTNVYPYDASGKPLVGVQLFDQAGRPLDVRPVPECPGGRGRWVANPLSWDPNCWDGDGVGTVPGRVSYLWTNGAAQLANVFPLPIRMQDDLHVDPNAFASATPPAIGGLPMAQAPAVSLPGIVASVQQTASPAPAGPEHQPRKRGR